MARQATVVEMRHILKVHSIKLMTLLGVSTAPCSISMPVDGKGARIKFSVLPGDVGKIPPKIIFSHHGEKLEIPLSVEGDFEPVKPQTRNM